MVLHHTCYQLSLLQPAAPTMEAAPFPLEVRPSGELMFCTLFRARATPPALSTAATHSRLFQLLLLLLLLPITATV